MNSSYEYDGASQIWPAFALSIATVTVVPVTAHAIYKTFASPENTADASNGQIPQKSIPKDVSIYKTHKKRRSSLFSKKTAFLLIGWILIAYLIYVIRTTETITVGQSFDPYELLGIEYGASDKDIKSVYKKLSIKFHPDKIRNKSEEEMLEIEQKFVLITKAYKALTDDVIKENYEKYGNPDGPQTTTHGIALPKWLVEGASSPLLIVAYILLICFVLPLLISNAWNNSKKITKKGIYSTTATLFTERLLNQKNTEIITPSVIMSFIAQADEYKTLLPGKTPEQIISLYKAYLNRDITTDSLTAVSIVPTLINGLVDIAATFRNTDMSLVATTTLKHFIQAVPEAQKPELLQLPHVDPSAIAKSKIVKLGKLFTLPRDEIKSVLGIQDDAKLEEAISVGSQIPRLDVVHAEFKVPGDTVVTPQSQAHISIKVLVRSPKHHGVAKIEASKLKEEETHENLSDPIRMMFEQPQLPIAHAPYFPEERQSGYIAFVVLQKDGKICESPVIIKNLSLENLALEESEFKDGTKLQVGTFKIPLTQPTPKETGHFQFRVIIKSLDYFTTDIDVPVNMHVQNPPKVEEVDYDIPTPKEDSIAGAMAGLRGEDVGAIDSDEDDSEFEEDEDFTDIDSDTDAEQD